MSEHFKRVATVDSVKDSVVGCTISTESKHSPISGSYVGLRVNGDRWLGRVMSVDMHNPIHEDDRFAALIMEHGCVPEWSGDTDIERAKVEIVQIVNDDGQFKSRDINPRSGTPLYAVNADMVKPFYNEKEHFAVIGTIAGSDAPATIINRGFGPWENGGYGEARHVAMFGKNGSGKSVWVLVLLCAKIAAHPETGFIIPDTQGDFADATKHDRGDFKFNYKTLLNKAGVKPEVIKIADIALKSTSILRSCLRTVFIKVYSIHPDKAGTLAGHVVGSMFDKNVNPKEITAHNIGANVCHYIEQVYAKASRKEKKEDAEAVMADPGRFRDLENKIKYQVLPYFTGKHDLGDVVSDVLTSGRKVIISMDEMAEYQQELVMSELMRSIKHTAQGIYKKGGDLARAIIVLDEAPRWVPQKDDKDSSDLSLNILAGMKETRKAGLGWWIVGQSPSDVSKEVLKQAHTTWFGRGLGIGADLTHMERVMGDSGMSLYKTLQGQAGRYFWVGVGLDNNIGSDTTPMAVHPFGGDSNKALIANNKGIFGGKR